jgi:hypothetical protein
VEVARPTEGVVYFRLPVDEISSQDVLEANIDCKGEA